MWEIPPYLKEEWKKITPQRQKRFLEVIQKRSSYIALVLEDIVNPQNASATLRTLEALGFYKAFIIEERNPFEIKKDVTRGVEKWLLLRFFSSTKECYLSLRKEGYKIAASSPHKKEYTPWNLPLEQPLAVVLGKEREGLTPYAIEEADFCFHIPMYGFVESFNLSVSCGITLFILRERLEKEKISSWELSEKEKEELLVLYLRRHLKERFRLKM